MFCATLCRSRMAAGVVSLATICEITSQARNTRASCTAISASFSAESGCLGMMAPTIEELAVPSCVREVQASERSCVNMIMAGPRALMTAST
ncbi:hypothetical protein D3C87_1606950 [compost metagenome]